MRLHGSGAGEDVPGASRARQRVFLPRLAQDYQGIVVLTSSCAAPELFKMRRRPSNHKAVITSRVKKILDVAAKEKAEVLILGAWGCGAFKNDPKMVSRAFHSLLKDYNFEVVEFALASRGDVIGSLFARG